MKRSARSLRTSLTAAFLCAGLALNVAALPYGMGTVTGDSLRMRADASTSSAILTTVPKGTQVEVLEDQVDNWYKVTYNGTTGYMFADYLSVTVSEDTSVDTNSPDTDSLGTGTLDTDGSSLNLRSGPGTNYGKLASIPADAVLTITEEENGWYKTSYNGVEGYVLSDYVVLSGPPTKYGVLNTNGSSLNLRSGPGTNYGKLASIFPGAVLTITGDENGWYQVSYNGMEGYVSSDYVLLTDKAAAADTTLAAQVIAYAKQFLGCPYVYGAAGSSSFDCSGFTSYVYKHFGYSLNRSAAGQYSNGTAVDQSQLQPGDLILWRAYGSSKTATHVGIYIGNNQYIHASSSKGQITIDDMGYAVNSRYVVGVRRIL